MKKYRICLFFIFVVGVFVSSALGYAVGRRRGIAWERTRQEQDVMETLDSERDVETGQDLDSDQRQNKGQGQEQDKGQNQNKNQDKNQGENQEWEMDPDSLPETLPEDHEASNQKNIGAGRGNLLVGSNPGDDRNNPDRAEEEGEQSYYLVAEDGFLLVFLKDRKTICLYTHMPLMDFSASEQERLREGIWFSSMIEVFNYLESCTS